MGSTALHTFGVVVDYLGRFGRGIFGVFACVAHFDRNYYVDGDGKRVRALDRDLYWRDFSEAYQSGRGGV